MYENNYMQLSCCSPQMHHSLPNPLASAIPVLTFRLCWPRAVQPPCLNLLSPHRASLLRYPGWAVGLWQIPSLRREWQQRFQDGGILLEEEECSSEEWRSAVKKWRIILASRANMCFSAALKERQGWREQEQPHKGVFVAGFSSEMFSQATT